MSVSLDILPLSQSLDMFGPVDRNSAYSLDGAIDIRISSPFSLFSRRQPTRILLRSLKIVFEGATAALGQGGFSSLRLCSVERELIDGEPVELNNDGLEDSNTPCSWNVLYNLAVPGWLPASTANRQSSSFGTRYALYATAQFTVLDSSSHHSIFSMCIPHLLPRNRTERASVPIIVRRLILPRALGVPPAMRSFLLDAAESAESAPKHDIPLDVISKVQILASVPLFQDVSQSSLDFVLRFRTPGLSAEQAERLHVTDIWFQFQQKEHIRSKPSRSYTTRFPIPAESSQPPNVPLRSANCFTELEHLEFVDFGKDLTPDTRTYSLLASTKSGHYHLDGNTQVFRSTTTERNTWYSMEFSMPIERFKLLGSSHWEATSDLQPSTQSAFYEINHTLTVSVDCMYEMEDGRQTTETLKFSTGINFADFASTPAVSLRATEIVPVSSAASSDIPSLTPSAPYALPVYSQLYDHNGDRKVDYTVPLPLYTPFEEVATPVTLPSSEEELKIPSEPSDEENAPLLS